GVVHRPWRTLAEHEEKRMRRTARFALAALAAPAALAAMALALPRSGRADWPNNPALNLAVCNAPAQQTDLAGCTDQAGGLIVAWADRRGGDADIYVQRIGPAGAPLWTAGGVRICNARLDQ